MFLRRLTALIPLTIFLVLVGFFTCRLKLIDQGHTPDKISSAMIGNPVPDFVLPSLLEDKPQVTASNLRGQVTLVNVFASWCVPCHVEHLLLTEIGKSGIRLVGLDYKDNPEAARQWLKKAGNPYDAIAADRDGRVAIDFGVYGVPESYLIDKQGIIRFKQTGPLTAADIQNILLPLARKLNE